MKKVIKYASFLLLSGSLMFTSCGKKSDDPTPDPGTQTPTPSGDEVCIGNNTVKITIDASTDATQNSFNGKSYSCTATTGKDVILYLDVKSKKDMDYIFIKKVTNGGTAAELKNRPTITSDDNKELKGGADFTYEVPGGDFISTALKVKVPVDQIVSGATDVYTVWFTKSAAVGGSKGDFTNPSNKTVVGPIYITIQNGTAAGLFATQSPLKLGDQANTTAPSYVTTSGGVNTLAGNSLIAGDATDEEKRISLNGADINFVSLNAAGTEQGDYSTPHFISVGLRQSLGFSQNNQGTTLTRFAKVTLPKAFSSMTASDIAALTSPPASSTKVKVDNNSSYVFLTADGRKGIIYASELAGSGTNRTVNVDVKVLASAQ